MNVEECALDSQLCRLGRNHSAFLAKVTGLIIPPGPFLRQSCAAHECRFTCFELIELARSVQRSTCCQSLMSLHGSFTFMGASPSLWPETLQQGPSSFSTQCDGVHLRGQESQQHHFGHHVGLPHGHAYQICLRILWCGACCGSNKIHSAPLATQIQQFPGSACKLSTA